MQPISFPVPDINLTPMMPLIVVAVTGILALVWQMTRQNRDNSIVAAIGIVGLLVAAGAILFQINEPSFDTASGMIVSDLFGRLMQLLVVVGTAATILFSEGYMREKRIDFAEFYPLVLWSAFGGMLMASSRNLVVIFLGLEVLSVSLYVMAGMSRTEEKSEESAMKYFLLGAFASAFLLYGIALIYGASGNLNLDYVLPAWLHGDATSRGLLLFGTGLCLVGLSFKASFVPFHQWTPDVYQGAPTNVTAYMATCSKVGAIAALFRVLEGTSSMSGQWIPALSVIAVLTMTVGNLLALAQKDVKRILGYSSIAHAGYILVGLLAHFKDPAHVGFTTTVFYLFAYMLMTIGAFAVVSMTARDGRETTRIEDLNGLYKRSPLAAVALVVFVASLIGVPPAAGFVGKMQIFNDALVSGLNGLALILAVNSVLSVAYYLSLARAAFVSDDEETMPARMSPGLASVCVICIVGVLVGSAVLPILAALR